MAHQSVTLRSNDSINLSTGVITRSSQSQTDTERHHQIMIKGLRSNYLLALQRAIEDDPSIPMAPGECGWTPEACRVNRQQHGPCLDH